MASIQQVFMNAIYYELSAISEYDALVDYVSQHYQDDNMVEPIWKYIKKYKHSFKAYEKLRSVVNEFRTLRIEQSEGFKRLIDNECSVRHSSYCTDIDDNEDGWIINDEEEVEESNRAFYWRVNNNLY